MLKNSNNPTVARNERPKIIKLRRLARAKAGSWDAIQNPGTK